MKKTDRVLARMGARELSVSEIEAVSGAAAFAHTNLCSMAMATTTHTGPGDGDACGDFDAN